MGARQVTVEKPWNMPGLVLGKSEFLFPQAPLAVPHDSCFTNRKTKALVHDSTVCTEWQRQSWPDSL